MKEWIYVCEPEPKEMLDRGILPKDTFHWLDLLVAMNGVCCWWQGLLCREWECFSSSPSATWRVSLVLTSLHFVLA